jgi:hypothetical protein
MKELPYFKFNVSEWLQGDITLSDFETQGLFVNICAYYWSKGGNINYSTLKLRLSQAKATLFEKLISLNVIKVNEKKDTINITFLDEQIADREKNYKLLSDAGKKGADIKRTKNQSLDELATLKPPLSQVETTHKQLDKEEDKEEEQDKEKIKYNDFMVYFNSNVKDIPKIRELTDKRKKLLKVILETYTKDDIQKVIMLCSQSDFLQGKIKSSGHENWIADFDFIFKRDNFIKILEGKYNNKQTVSTTFKSLTYSDMEVKND